MTDDTESTATTDAAPTAERTFTQAELNEIVAKEKAKQKASFEKAEAEKIKQAEEAKRIEALEGIERERALHKAEMDRIEKEYGETRRQLAIAKAEARLSSLGLPTVLAPQMIGADDDATEANITAVKGYLDAEIAKGVKAGLSTGTPSDPATAQAPAEDDLIVQMRAAAGLPPKR